MRFAIALSSAFLLLSGPAFAGAEATKGSWSGLYDLPLVPASAALTPNGKLVLWAADGEFGFAAAGKVNWSVFDPATGSATKSVFEGGHNMFCTGTTVLPDGRILANGGSNAAITSIYDPSTDRFTRVQNMVLERGYNANTILADGTVFTYGGAWSGAGSDRSGEIWTESAGWRKLSGIPITAVSGWGDESYHYWLLPGGNGKVIYAGPKPQMKWLDTTGDGSVSDAGPRGDDAYANSGIAVMYDTGKILKAGGVPGYGGLTSAASYKIDITSDAPVVTKIAPMAYPRAFANSVVLPDGKVMIVGGQTYAKGFSDDDSVMIPELWDPATERTTLMAPIAVGRNYHSVALLLQDGRVMSGGGGLCGDGCAGNHPNLQIWTPPYLYNDDGSLRARPSILTAPGSLPYGRTVTVTTDRPVTAFSIVRFGATTHTVNNDQRRLALVSRQISANTYEVDVPSNPGWMLPGKWMLFALDAAGTPSVSRVVDVVPNGLARIVGPGVVVANVGTPISVAINAAKLKDGVVFGGRGLPAGVTVDPSTGAVSGAPTVAGTFKAAITATDGTITISTDFTIAVDPPLGTGTGLLADYFANTTLSGSPVLTRRETPDFDWNTASPGAGVPADNFSVRWSGTLTAMRSGATRLRTQSDDGVRLWVDGKLLVDNWTIHGVTSDEGTIDLESGKSYAVLLEYYESNGPASLRLNWLRPGDTGFTAIPLGQLNGPDALPATNMALGKTATQSSQLDQGAAGRAVDGNTDGNYGAASVAHTNNETNAWWQVDLGSLVRIDRVRLWNRTDCCTERLNDFRVFFSRTDLTGRSFADIDADAAVARRSVGRSTIPSNIDVPAGVTARYVRVQLTGTNYLHMAEVEVFGTLANTAPSIPAIADVLTNTGSKVSVAVGATDPEGDVLTYAATNLPAGLAIDPATGVISGSPTASGSTTATVTVTDPGSLSASGTVRFTVTDNPLTVLGLAVPIAKVGVPVTYAPKIRYGEGATYTWDFGNGTPATSPSISPRRTKTWSAAGTYSVTLTATAANGRPTIYRFSQAVVPNTTVVDQIVPGAGLAVETRPGASSRLWVANPDTDTVGVVDLTSNDLVAEVPVGDRPVAVGINANGDVWVVNRESATISIIDAGTLTVKRTVTLSRGSRPWGLVFVNKGADGVVALEAKREMVLVRADGSIAGSATAGPSPRHIAATADGGTILISNFITPPLPGESTAKVRTVGTDGKPVGGLVNAMNLSGVITGTAVLRHSEEPDSEVSARGIPNYLGTPAISPDGRFAWVPSKQDNVKRGTLRDGQGLDFQTTVRAIVSKIDLSTMKEVPSARVDLDNSGIASAAVFHPSGAWLFVALQASREVAVVDPGRTREVFRFKVGRAPSGLAISPDGDRLYVQNFMDRTIQVVSLDALVKDGQKTVRIVRTVQTINKETLSATVLKGKQFFYDAGDRRLARDGYLSCAVCHENGESDGRTWDFTGFGEGLRNTISLLGHGGTGQGFLHWTANFDEGQDFEGQIRSFAQGTGLMADADFNAGTRSTTLGDKKAGLSKDLDALAAYMKSLNTVPAGPGRNQDGTATADAVLGAAAFTTYRCNSCHGGSELTISSDASRLKNIGTIDAAAGQRLGGPLTGFDIPTLYGVYATAPYLHDGSAATIEDAIRAHTKIKVPVADVSKLGAYIRGLENTR